jgi:hypothetical protein
LVQPEVDIKAILPDGSEALPVPEQANADDDLTGFAFLFDPPLPDGSVIELNGQPLHTVRHPAGSDT